MSDVLRLFGLKAIVTGAASGIGEAIVRTFVKQGSQVLAVDSADSGIEKHFRKVAGVSPATLDMSAADAPKQLVSLAKKSLGALDIVVSNFDWHGDTVINDGDADAADALIGRLVSRIETIFEAALPMLQKSPAGRMIAIGALRSAFGRQGERVYRKSEQSLHSLVGKLADRGGEFGVTANFIQPGAVMTRESRPVFAADRELRDHCIRMSAARRLAEPVDIAKVVLFLATDDSVFVSGTGIRADGGTSVR